MKLLKKLTGLLTAAACAFSSVAAGITPMTASAVSEIYEPGIKIEDVSVPYGTDVVTLDISLTGGVNSIACSFMITYPEEFTLIDGPTGAMSTSPSGNTIAAVFVSGNSLKTDLSTITFGLPYDSYGTYPIDITVDSLDNNGELVENPVGYSGSITVEEPIEYPTEKPTDTQSKGIKVEDVSVPYGTDEVTVGLSLAGDITTYGCLFDIAYPKELTLVDGPTGAMTYTDSSAGMIKAIVFASSTPLKTNFSKIKFALPEGASGTYPIEITIDSLDDNGNYAENPVGYSGSITVEEPIEYPTEKPTDTQSKGIKVEDVSVPYGTKEATVGLSFVGDIISYGPQITIYYSEELTLIDGPTGAMATASDSGQVAAVFASGSPFDKDFSTITFRLPEGASGTYPIEIKIDSLDNNGDYVESPVGYSGSITVEEPIEYPTEKPTDTQSKGIKVEDVSVPYGTDEVTLDILLVGDVSSWGCQFEITYPKELTLIDGPTEARATYSFGNTIAAVFADHTPIKTNFSKIKFALPEGASGTYPIEITITSLDENGSYVENPVGYSGSITIEEPATEEPTEPPTEPTEAPTQATTKATANPTTSVTTKKTTAVATTKPILKGDISGNGKIDLYDAIMIAKFLGGKINFTNKKIADFNGDGKIDLYDTIAIAKEVTKEMESTSDWGSSSGSVGVSVGDAVVEAGTSEVALPISFVGDIDSCGCAFKITYPEELTLVNFPTGAMVYKQTDNSVYAVFVNGTSLKQDFSTITFEIPENYGGVTYLIDISVYAMDNNGEYVESPAGNSGSITVKSPATEPTDSPAVTTAPTTDTEPDISTKPVRRGDISGNGDIDLYDAIMIAKSLLGVIKFNDAEKNIADYDNNGQVNLYDAIGIAKYLLQKK